MTYIELKTRLAKISHRNDLSSDMYDFIQDTTEKLNVRFGLTNPPLVNDGDTNPILTSFSFVYISGALTSLYEHLNNGENVLYYSNKFETECDNLNITNPTVATDVYYNNPPFITPEA